MKEKLESKIESSVQSILIEITQRDWKEELKHFYLKLKEHRFLESFRQSSNPTFLKVWKKIQFPRRRFFLTLFYAAPATYFFLRGAGLIGVSHLLGTALLFSSFAGLLYLVTRAQPHFSRLREKYYLYQFLKVHKFDPVEPEDLILFWRQRARGFLDSRQDRLRDRTITLESKKEDAELTIAELKKLSSPGKAEPIAKLQEHLGTLDLLQNDSLKASRAIDHLRERLENRVSKLSEILTEFRTHESERVRIEELENKVGRILGEKDELQMNWSEEKEGLEEQLRDLVETLQEELFLSKEYLLSQYELENPDPGRSEVESVKDKNFSSK